MSMNSKEFVLNSMRETGRAKALNVQSMSEIMTGTELNAEADYIPDFRACGNMINREAGFVCKSTAGRVVKLLQPYDSEVYTAEPEELPAQWGFVWSQEAEHALPFVAISTSPYMVGDCCIEGETVYRSLIDNNVWNPSSYAQGWEVVS